MSSQSILTDGRRVQIGLVGFGQVVGHDHLQTLSLCNKLSVSAVADISDGTRARAQKLLPDVSIHSNLSELLSLSSPDVICIGTPPSTHEEYIIQGLDLGLTIVCEKPVAPNLRAFYKIQDALKRSSGRIIPCHNWKNALGMRKALAAVQNNLIGMPYDLSISIQRTRAAIGNPDWNPNWRYDSGIALGGVWMDFGPHVVYVAEALMGVPITDVNLYATWDSADPLIDLRCQGMLYFAGKRAASIDVSWIADTRKTEFLLKGTEGSLLISNDKITRVSSDGSETIVWAHPTFTPWGSDRTEWYLPVFRQATRQDAKSDNENIAEIGRIASALDGLYKSRRSDV